MSHISAYCISIFSVQIINIKKGKRCEKSIKQSRTVFFFQRSRRRRRVLARRTSKCDENNETYLNKTAHSSVDCQLSDDVLTYSERFSSNRSRGPTRRRIIEYQQLMEDHFAAQLSLKAEARSGFSPLEPQGCSFRSARYRFCTPPPKIPISTNCRNVMMSSSTYVR